MAGACRGDACGHSSTRRVRQRRRPLRGWRQPAREVIVGTAPVRPQGQRRLPQGDRYDEGRRGELGFPFMKRLFYPFELRKH
ncbi:hypothetical protein B296_00018075 [Ensete ventricosum]|uniref:Uncharacterized protein n=1 Tax=Ensete ventricosum TaxID=4639 RepID=A0A426YG26_ENSVE|nr:hypothetical protein B296_00018075 [Ensete ventricosum]